MIMMKTFEHILKALHMNVVWVKNNKLGILVQNTTKIPISSVQQGTS